MNTFKMEIAKENVLLQKEELNKHFSNQFKVFINKIKSVIAEINELNKEIEGMLERETTQYKLYEELQEEFIKAYTAQACVYEQIQEYLEKLIELLNSKLENPFDKIEYEEEKLEYKLELIEELNKLGEVINNIIDRHNYKYNNLVKELQEAQKKIELHYVCQEVNLNKIFTIQREKEGYDKSLEIAKTNYEALLDEIKKLEKEISNEVLGAQEFNERLHKFLGHKEISMQFDTKKGGYLLIRNASKEIAKNLSEGEKTAVAFIYFITKVKELGNQISNSIIVLDDPISSFDSNRLFYAYASIKQEFNSSKQLFILTHNFPFYKLVRDWLYGKNKKGQPIKTRIYTIESRNELNNESLRYSILNNATSTLVKYESEYYYLFCRIYKYKDQQSLSVEEAFNVGNLARKLLEGFLTFKYPKKRGTFKDLVDKAIKDANMTTIQGEEIYRFINKYSHNQTIEIIGEGVDNLIGESQNIIGQILDLLKRLDNNHYTEMEELIRA